MALWFDRPEVGSHEWVHKQRARMVAEQLQPRGIRDERVLSAMLRVPRHLFVPPRLVQAAYEDEALAIDCGQTISQPYMVAIMSQELALAGGERVLEIGTGSGYQTAVLAELLRGCAEGAEGSGSGGGLAPAGHIHTVERIGEFSRAAQTLLGQLGYDNVSFRVGDGSQGWGESAPFDAVLMTAGAPSVPDGLIEQLKPGGRFVGPIGPMGVQILVKWTRTEDGRILKRDLMECRFVRLIGAGGWEN